MSRADRVLRAMQSRGVRRGVFGSSRGWFWVAVAAFLLRRFRRIIGSEAEVVFRGELKRGHTLRIDHLTETYGSLEQPKRRRWGRRS
jgi:hypothetical protein